MLYGYSNLFLNFCQPLNGDYSKFFWSFSMRCISALRFVLFIHKINSGCQSVFVVELATREDSHKNNEKQPVTLSAAFWRFQATIHSLPCLNRSTGFLCALWHLPKPIAQLQRDNGSYQDSRCWYWIKAGWTGAISEQWSLSHWLTETLHGWTLVHEWMVEVSQLIRWTINGSWLVRW